MTLQELIERLEGLSGPDHEVDCAIGLATGWRREIIQRAGREDDEHWYRPDGKIHGGFCPFFTASLDAALLLVPGGMWAVSGPWTFSEGHEKAGQNSYDAACFPDDGPSDYESLRDFDDSGSGATPAIALCIASLRARLAPSPSSSTASPPNLLQGVSPEGKKP